jgi:hypothetical protein
VLCHLAPQVHAAAGNVQASAMQCMVPHFCTDMAQRSTSVPTPRHQPLAGVAAAMQTGTQGCPPPHMHRAWCAGECHCRCLASALIKPKGPAFGDFARNPAVLLRHRGAAAPSSIDHTVAACGSGCSALLQAYLTAAVKVRHSSTCPAARLGTPTAACPVVGEPRVSRCEGEGSRTGCGHHTQTRACWHRTHRNSTSTVVVSIAFAA